MKIINVLFSWGLGLILFLGVLSPIDVAAEEFVCQMRATLDNYYVFIRDFDRDGNPTGHKLYKGWLMRGNTLPLTSRSGRISYSFKADSDYRDSSSNEEACRNNRIIWLP
jgi:hypothetical protein